MFCEKLTEEQIRKVMNVISDDGALTILKIRTYDKSFEDAVAVSAVPMAARVSQKVGQSENPSNFLLMHAMGPNVAGVIGSAVAAGILINMFG